MKFNPYHDPRNGRFTFAPGGPQSLSGVVISRRRAPYALPEGPTRLDLPGIPSDRSVAGATPDLKKDRRDKALLESIRGSADRLLEPARSATKKIADEIRAVSDEIGSIYDILPSETEWNGLPLLVVPDEVFEFPRKTTDEAKHVADTIIAEVERFVPAEYLGDLDIRRPIDDAVEYLREVRLIRAAAAIKFKSDVKPMQVEMMRLMQKEADGAYERGVDLIASGKLKIHISRELTLGNYIDGQVRTAMRKRFDRLEINTAGKGPVRINRQEAETSGDERTYYRPDARVATIAYDVTLSRKLSNTPQVIGFFATDFQPSLVIIVRPRQLKDGGSYIIPRGRSKR